MSLDDDKDAYRHELKQYEGYRVQSISYTEHEWLNIEFTNGESLTLMEVSGRGRLAITADNTQQLF